MKCFISYTANKEISFLHIKEAITRSKNLARSIQARFGIEKDDLIVDCWLRTWEESDTERQDVMYHRNAYSNTLVSSYLQDRQIRKTTSIVVSYFLMEVYRSEKDKEEVRLDYSTKMKDTIRDIFKNSSQNHPDLELNSKDEIRWNYVEKTLDALSDAGLRPEHMVLLNWQIGIIDEDEAMKMLGVSRRTLFNRWNKVKPEIIKAYYKPLPRKRNSPQETGG